MNASIPTLLLAVFTACVTFATAPIDEKLKGIQTDRSAHFETIGFDRKSVYSVAGVGRATAQICETFLPEIPVEFPQRITVLLDEGEPQVAEPQVYALSMADGGFVTLRIFWNEGLVLEELCHAMMEAFLLRYGHYKYGRQATSGMRAWVIAGLGQKCFLRYRPAETEFLAANPPRLTQETVSTILKLSASEPCDRTLAYRLFESFCALELKRDEKRQLLEFALMGGSIDSELSKTGQGLMPEADNRPWWETGMESFVRKYRGSIDSMEASRLWLEGLADMDAFAKDPSKDSSKPNLRELGAHGQDDVIRAEIRARQAVLLSGMLRVNPLYYNAAQSLGRYYEQILYSEPGFRRTATLIDYLNDLNAARRIQSLAKSALEAPKQASR